MLRHALAVVVCSLGFASPALAADAGAPKNTITTENQGDDVDALVRSLGSDAKSLSTDDCAGACKALASMRRAADRICALDSGRRCTDARSTVDDASKRVKEACPDCAVASLSPPKPEVATTPSPAPPMKGDTVQAESAKSRGGCAGCGGGGGGSAAAIAGIVWAISRLRRRKS